MNRVSQRFNLSFKATMFLSLIWSATLLGQSSLSMQQQNQTTTSPCITGQETGCSTSGQNPLSIGSVPMPQASTGTGMQGTRLPGQNTITNFSDDSLDVQQRQSVDRPRKRLPSPPTEFEQLVADSVGRRLPIFGTSFFENSLDTFAPLNRVPVPSNYVLGPGDEVDVRIWGPISLTSRTTIDRNGEIYLPQVGQIRLAGVKSSDLESSLRNSISRVFKNFELAASLGRLRSVQVFVVGEASNPGQFTISSLSTLVNAIFASGGPSSSGSLRHVQLRQGGKTIEFDLYDMLVKGDKSKDVPVQPGDVIYYPPAEGFIAVAGSVSMPAIYELTQGETLARAIEIAGGPTTMADVDKVIVERLDSNNGRTVREIPFKELSNVPARKGDIVRVVSVVPRFDQTVTLRGNVLNPGRYAWKPGMTVRDLIPSADYLLTRGYWLDQARLTNGMSREYPVTLPAKTPDSERTDATPSQPGDDKKKDLSQDSKQGASKIGQNAPTQETLAADIRQAAPEINWDYAIIQRINPVDLSTQLIPFHLGKAIIDKDPAANLELKSGDIVTIFSQKDVSVPQSKRTQFIKIQGEVHAPGIYLIQPGDTLRSVVERAGGLTESAYLYGSQLTRVSVREQQQRSLDEFASLLSVQMRLTSAALANGNPDRAGDLGARSTAQEQIISSLRDARPVGRVVLEMRPDASGSDTLPAITLEDGDELTVPHRPAVITVIGSVYNQGSFLYRPTQRLRSYLNSAGRPTPIADRKHVFVIRADGSVLAPSSSAWKGSLENARVYPGDTIVVPSKLQIGAFQRNLQNWTQIFSQIALTAASLAVLAKQ